MSIKRLWDDFWSEAKRPSTKDETIWQFCASQTGHYFIGNVLAVLGSFIPFIWIVAPILYFVVKERGDMRRGGTWTDSLCDAFFVLLGASFLIIHPWNILIAFVAIVLMAYAKYTGKRTSVA